MVIDAQGKAAMSRIFDTAGQLARAEVALHGAVAQARPAGVDLGPDFYDGGRGDSFFGCSAKQRVDVEMLVADGASDGAELLSILAPQSITLSRAVDPCVLR
jgi:hypothetical protein